MELTTTFMTLLDNFHPVFTAPSFATFRLLMTGWILSHRHRYVTDLIVSSDSVDNGHFSDYHRFFSQAAWSLDFLWRMLMRLVVDRLVGPEGAILLAGDDTLCNKSGLGLFGAGMHHDPLISSKAMKLVSWGHDWVNLCVVIVRPWWAPTKVFALPVCMRLYRNKQGVTKGKKETKAKPASKGKKKPRPKGKLKGKAKAKARAGERAAKQRQKKKSSESGHKTRPELMREMLQLVAGWFPDRQFEFVADSLYTGKSVLRHLPENMHMIGGVHPTGAMYAPRASALNFHGWRPFYFYRAAGRIRVGKPRVA